jgi:hypothetical protein
MTQTLTAGGAGSEDRGPQVAWPAPVLVARGLVFREKTS